MKVMMKAFAKQYFGAKYEGIAKSLTICVILFLAVYGTQLKVRIAPSVFYLTSTAFSGGIMAQILLGRRLMETMEGMFVLPFKNRDFVLACVFMLGSHTILTKTLPVWALFLAAGQLDGTEIITGILYGCMACLVTGAMYLLWKKRNYWLPLVWAAGIFTVILWPLCREMVALMAVASSLGALLYLRFADAYGFLHKTDPRPSFRHTGGRGSVFVYLLRYFTANKSCCLNTLGLCAAAALFPWLFGSVSGISGLPLGFALLCLNTPVCTILSGDPALEQALHILPGQSRRFCRKYGLFISMVNLMIYSIYLCSWQLINGGLIGGASGSAAVTALWMALVFAFQSASLSVYLEWAHPIRGWKTESDLWHHPRKYIVPLLMLLAAALTGAWPLLLWVWTAILLVGFLVVGNRRQG